jgi:hypothetical protein
MASSIRSKNSTTVGKSDCILAGYDMRWSVIPYSSSVGVIPVIVFIELFMVNSTYMRYSDQSYCLILI